MQSNGMKDNAMKNNAMKRAVYHDFGSSLITQTIRMTSIGCAIYGANLLLNSLS